MSEEGWVPTRKQIEFMRRYPAQVAERVLGYEVGPEDRATRLVRAIGVALEDAPDGARVALALTRRGVGRVYAVPADVEDPLAAELRDRNREASS